MLEAQLKEIFNTPDPDLTLIGWNTEAAAAPDQVVPGPEADTALCCRENVCFTATDAVGERSLSESHLYLLLLF